MVKQNKKNLGAYVSPVIIRSVMVQSTVLCQSKEVTYQTEVIDESFSTTVDSFLMF